MGLLGISPDGTESGYANMRKRDEEEEKLVERRANFKYLHNL
jgi:hypothetical protein